MAVGFGQSISISPVKPSESFDKGIVTGQRQIDLFFRLESDLCWGGMLDVGIQNFGQPQARLSAQVGDYWLAEGGLVAIRENELASSQSDLDKANIVTLAPHLKRLPGTLSSSYPERHRQGSRVESCRNVKLTNKLTPCV